MAQGNEPEIRYLWPSWRYGPDGASKICYAAEDVPDGWFDTPDKLVAPAPPAPDKVISILDAPPNSELTRLQIMAALKAKGVKFRPTLSTELLRECLSEAEAAE